MTLRGKSIKIVVLLNSEFLNTAFSLPLFEMTCLQKGLFELGIMFASDLDWLCILKAQVSQHLCLDLQNIQTKNS